MLADAFSSTDVSLEGVRRLVVVRTPSDFSVHACAGLYDARSGSGCEVSIPRAAFAATQSVQAHISLELEHASPIQANVTLAGGDRIVSNVAKVTLVGQAAELALQPSSGAAVAPARHVHPGEEVAVSAYMHTASDSVSGVALRWQIDPSILSFARFDYPAGWKVRCACVCCENVA